MSKVKAKVKPKVTNKKKALPKVQISVRLNDKNYQNKGK